MQMKNSTAQALAKENISFSRLPGSKLVTSVYNLLSLDDSLSDKLLSKEMKDFRGARVRISTAIKLCS